VFLFGPFISAFFIYLVTRWVTEDNTLDWRDCLLWVVGTTVAGFLVRFVTGTGFLHMEEPVPDILGIIASILALAVILWYQGIRPKVVWIIIGLYVFVRFGFLLLILVIRYA